MILYRIILCPFFYIKTLTETVWLILWHAGVVFMNLYNRLSAICTNHSNNQIWYFRRFWLFRCIFLLCNTNNIMTYCRFVHKFFFTIPFAPLFYPFYTGFVTLFPQNFPKTYIIHSYTYLYRYVHLCFYYVLDMFYVCFILKRV